VLAEAHLRSEEGAGWALVFPVTVVGDRVVAGMGPGAGSAALRRPGAAADGRVLDCGAALAYALVEGGDQAALTLAGLVAQLVALVETAVEKAVAGEQADVVFVAAAELVALVAAAGLFARAAAVAQAILVS